MSNNEELLNRFREMIEKKKSEEKKKIQNTNPLVRNSQVNDPEVKVVEDIPQSEEEKIRSNKNEYEEKSNTFLEKLRKMRNEVFDDVKGTEMIKNENLLNGDKSDEENREIQDEYKNLKPRPSVFDLARKYEKKDKEKPQLKVLHSDNKFSNNKSKNELDDKIKISDSSKEEIHDEIYKAPTEIESNTPSIMMNIKNDDPDEEMLIRNSERTSNSRLMLLNSLRIIKEEEEKKVSTKPQVRKSDYSNSNFSQTINDEFKDNIITELPKKLVKDLIKMNEKRIRSKSENKNIKQRNTVTQNFRNNISEIRGFINSLNEKNNENQDITELVKNNPDALKKFGIEEKDAKIVQELIEFYEISSNSAKDRNGFKPIMKNRKQRNTVSNLTKKNRMVIDVETIAEEKEEEASLAESWRKSGSQRFSNQENRRENNHIINESFESNSESHEEDDKIIDIVIAEDEQNFDNENENPREKVEKINTEIDTAQIYDVKLEYEASPEINQLDNIDFVHQPTNINCVDVHNLELSNKCEEIHIPNTVNNNSSINIVKENNFEYITCPKINKMYDELILRMTNPSVISYEPIAPEYLKVNESLFSIEGDQNLNKRSQKFFKFDHQNQILINPTPRIFNLKLSYEHSTSFIYKKLSTEKNSISSSCQLELNTNLNKKNIVLIKNNSESTADNLISLVNHNIENECNKEWMNISDNQNLSENNKKVKSIPVNFMMMNENELNKINSDKYHKNIINSLDSISIIQYKLDSKFTFDPRFFDVLCTNCYECVRYEEIDLHSDKCVLQPDENFEDFYDAQESDEDYNSKIFKLHESLKNRHDEIYSTSNQNLIRVYENFVKLTYEILLNNNSIEELDKSITNLNDLLNNKLCKINSKYNFTLVVLGQRISQLVLTKLEDMEKILMCVKANEDFDENRDSIDIMHDEKEKLYVESEDEEDPENKEIEILKKELVTLEKQTFDTRKEIEEWRKESKKLENMLRKPIQNMEVLSDIISDVVSKKEESVIKYTFNNLII